MDGYGMEISVLGWFYEHRFTMLISVEKIFMYFQIILCLEWIFMIMVRQANLPKGKEGPPVWRCDHQQGCTNNVCQTWHKNCDTIQHNITNIAQNVQ